MAVTSGSYTIGTDQNYATLNAFVDDIGSLTGDITGTVMTSGECCSAVPTIDHASNTYACLVTVNSSVRFTASASWPADMKAAATDCAYTNYSIRPNTAKVTIEWLSLGSTDSTGQDTIIFESGSPSACVIRFILAVAARYWAVGCWGDPGSSIVHNCIFADDSTSGNGVFQYGAGTLSVYHVTTKGLAAGFKRSAGTLNCYGCLAYGGTAGFSGTIGGDENASGDTSAPGTTHWHSIADPFEDSNFTGGADLHLSSGVDGTYECTDRSGTIGSTDIDGETRVDWDIGALEIVGAPPAGLSIPIAMRHYATIRGE